MSKIKRAHGKPQRKLFEKEPLVVGERRITRNMLTENQKKADDDFRDWFMNRSSRERIHRIGAGAGAGKSWLIRYLVEAYGFDRSNCAVMSYTGQSVNVLRKMGVLANTIHSTIMVPIEEPVLDRETGLPILKRGIPLTKVTFRPVRSMPKTLELFIVDEASFLPAEIERRLYKYKIPILEIGDPVQLPPVADRQVFTMDSLDYFMEGVIRQRDGSELYDFLTKLRKKKNIDISRYHDEVLFLQAQPTIEETFERLYPFFRHADVIVTSTNKQRQVITDLYRKHVIGTNSPYPREGERMICRHNNWGLMLDQYALTNGTQGICLHDVGRSMVDHSNGTYMMDFQPEVTRGTDLKFNGLLCDSEFLFQPFGQNNMIGYKRPGEKFEYAHAITSHLTQGSTYDNVLFMDSFSPDLNYLMRLRYTAASRARKRLVYVLPYSRYPDWCDLENIEERMARDAERRALL